MLVQYSSLSALDPSALARLKAQVNNLIQTHEALQNKYVVFEGHVLQLSELRALAQPNPKQMLFG
jgi:hypothetical protein